MAPEPDAPGRPQDKLVLIVDDDADMLDLLTAIVGREGFRTAQLSDGGNVSAKAEELRPDLIVCDLMLPQKGGMEIVRELQASEMRAVPVIIVTARKMDRDALDMISREPNVRGCLDKPVKAAAFAALLHSSLRTKPDAQRRPAW